MRGARGWLRTLGRMVSNRLYSVVLVTIGCGLLLIAALDLMGLNTGTCAAGADVLTFVCWGTRFIRYITGWPTNVASAVENLTYAVLAIGIGFLIGGQDE